ncbi:MAG: DUF3857 domain-containing protein, partial [Bacteroidota bacterium]
EEVSVVAAQFKNPINMFTHKASIFLLLILCISFSSTAQSNLLYSVQFIPAELLKNANDVTRLESRMLEIKSTKEASLFHKVAVTILNSDSKNNVFVAPYDKQSKVKRIRARLYDANGNLIRKIKDEEIQDVSSVSDFSIYEDDRLKYLEVTHSSYPYTIEYEYELTAKGMLMCALPNWNIQGYRSSIQSASYQIQLPQNLKLYYKALNLDVEPAVESKGGYETYTWQLENIPAKRPEAYSPSASSILPRLWVTLDQFEIGSYEGSFRSWTDFGLFMHRLYEGRDELSEATQQEILNLTANATSAADKIGILYDHLQKNMRYVSVQLGIGGWQPFDAAYVEKNKYGDCKALTNYMKSMLKVVGVKAYPVLIYSSRNPDYIVTEDFTSARFNHVILNVPSEDIWLECTSSELPANYIGLSNADRNALLITEEGGKIVRTPKYDKDLSVEQNKVQIHLTPNGSARIEGVCELRGPRHEAYRSISANYPREDFEKWYRRNSELPSFQIEKMDYKADEHHPGFELTTSFQVNNYASKAGKRLFVPLNKINPFKKILKNYENRKHPVVIREGYTEIDEIEFHLPEGYQLESAPKEKSLIESVFGSYEAHIEKKGNCIVYKRKFVLNPTEKPADQYKALRDFFKAVSKADSVKMVLVQKKT